MQKIKTMPFSEKYSIVLDQIKSHEVLISRFIKKHLDEQALIELQKLWQEGVKPIPEEASDEIKYETAYSNLMWQGKSSLEFISVHLGKGGLEQYKLEQVEELKRKNAGPILTILELVRTIVPGSAYTMTARKMAYQIKWLLPSMSLIELTADKAIYNISQRKVASYPDMALSIIFKLRQLYGGIRRW